MTDGRTDGIVVVVAVAVVVVVVVVVEIVVVVVVVVSFYLGHWKGIMGRENGTPSLDR